MDGAVLLTPRVTIPQVHEGASSFFHTAEEAGTYAYCGDRLRDPAYWLTITIEPKNV